MLVPVLAEVSMYLQLHMTHELEGLPGPGGHLPGGHLKVALVAHQGDRQPLQGPLHLDTGKLTPGE